MNPPPAQRIVDNLVKNLGATLSFSVRRDHGYQCAAVWGCPMPMPKIMEAERFFFQLGIRTRLSDFQDRPMLVWEMPLKVEKGVAA